MTSKLKPALTTAFNKILPSTQNLVKNVATQAVAPSQAVNAGLNIANRVMPTNVLTQQQSANTMNTGLQSDPMRTFQQQPNFGIKPGVMPLNYSAPGTLGNPTQNNMGTPMPVGGVFNAGIGALRNVMNGINQPQMPDLTQQKMQQRFGGFPSQPQLGSTNNPNQPQVYPTNPGVGFGPRVNNFGGVPVNRQQPVNNINYDQYKSTGIPNYPQQGQGLGSFNGQFSPEALAFQKANQQPTQATPQMNEIARQMASGTYAGTGKLGNSNIF